MLENHLDAYGVYVYQNRNQLKALNKHLWSVGERDCQYHVVYASLATKTIKSKKSIL